MSVRKKGRSTTTFKDVQIAYLISGLSSIEQMYNKRQVSINTIRKALSNLKTNGTVVDSFEKWFFDNFGLTTRGRAAPKVGQERIYRAQQIKTSGAFLRLPLAALSIDKGEDVTVRFEPDQIVVKKI